MMKTFTRFALLSLAFTTSLNAYALDCDNALTTVDMRECQAIEYEKADKELNATYKKVMPRLDKTGQDLLVAAEKSWINFRDRHCTSYADQMRDGTAQPLLYVGCLTTMTKDRTTELKEYLEAYK